MTEPTTPEPDVANWTVLTSAPYSEGAPPLPAGPEPTADERPAP